ncbi:MAG: hypothetical protein R3206_07425, partial [Salegentibacter mishustinae]|nr:hypothetical protein [Salegentibacter mishustinae]
ETDTLSNFASSFKVILFFIYLLFNPARGIYGRLIIISFLLAFIALRTTLVSITEFLEINYSPINFS